MSTDKNPEEFYEKLKDRLYKTSSWPSEYLYKFIIKSDKRNLVIIEDLFNNVGAVINTKESKNGKYTSISINLLMSNPEAVIEKYQEVINKVEGVISL
jgi:putative lipoic acid-binding regulatory protein